MSAYESRPSLTEKAAPDVVLIDTATIPQATDIAAVDALVESGSYNYSLGFRDGHAAGLLQADREVCDSVRRMMADLDSWGWGGL